MATKKGTGTGAKKRARNTSSNSNNSGGNIAGGQQPQQILDSALELRTFIAEMHRAPQMRGRIPQALRGVPGMFGKYVTWLGKNLKHFYAEPPQEGLQQASTTKQTRAVSKRRASTKKSLVAA